MEDEICRRFITAAGRDGTWDWDIESNRIAFDPAWKRLFGFKDEDIGSDPEEWLGRIHPNDYEGVKSEIESHLAGHTPCFVSEHRLLDKNGNYRWIFCRGLAETDESGQQRFVGLMTDFSESKMTNEQLRQEAFHDSLTGLPNRTVFKDRVGRSLERGRRRGDYLFAVMYLDIDRFKGINDGMGHAVGDQLLIEVGQRLEKCLRQTDTVARLGGDEFGLLLDEIKDVSDTIKVAERIKNIMRRPFILSDEEVFTSISAGIALSSKGYDFVDEIITDADIAMYRAKERGGGTHEIFDKNMHAMAVQKVELENNLRRAVERNEFVIQYQPIFDLQAEKLSGFEALVRWLHPDKGLVSPGSFIPLAEDTGIIVDIDRLVMREACRQMHEWREKWPHARDLSVSVNLSRKQFRKEEVVNFISKTLETTGLPSDAFRVEITESQIMQDTDVAMEILDQLKGLNILLHMDDFGKGYSSLSYLVKFHVDTLKIDGSFVSNMHKRGENFEIVRMVVSLAHNLGMKVIAEGIEDKLQLEELQQLKCELGQGYFLAYPLDVEMIEAYLKKNRNLKGLHI